MMIKSILLAEDNVRDAELTKEALNLENLCNPIVHVTDGVQVIEYLRMEGEFKNREEGLPAVLLLDLKMPRMDGLEVLEVIRHDENFKYLPVVMLTSSRMEEDLVRSYNLGANAYVVKPIDLNEFFNAIKQLGMFWVLVNETPS